MDRAIVKQGGRTTKHIIYCSGDITVFQVLCGLIGRIISILKSQKFTLTKSSKIAANINGQCLSGINSSSILNGQIARFKISGFDKTEAEPEVPNLTPFPSSLFA